MPLMISRIGHARGRPVLFAAGRWGSITRHSLSVTSVWYRFVSRICCIRVVWVHMVSPGLVSATPWNHAHPSHSTAFETASKDLELLMRYLVPVFLIQNFTATCRIDDPAFLFELPHGANTVDELSEQTKREITDRLTDDDAKTVVLVAANTRSEERSEERREGK